MSVLPAGGQIRLNGVRCVSCHIYFIALSALSFGGDLVVRFCLACSVSVDICDLHLYLDGTGSDYVGCSGFVGPNRT